MELRENVREMEDGHDARLPMAIVAAVTIMVLLLSLFALMTYSWQKCAQSWGTTGSIPALTCKAPVIPPLGWKPTPVAQKEIPADILNLYIAAGQRFDVAWPVLAGIGKMECDHARSTLLGCHSGQNFAGAMGPMQFLAGTWAKEEVPAPGHTDPSVYDPGDAIYSAANYLANMGAAGITDIDSSQMQQVIYGYNHSLSYVSSVISYAHQYATPEAPSGATSGNVFGNVGNVLGKLAPLFPWVPQGGFPGIRFYVGFDDQCTYYAAYEWPGRNGQGVTWSDNAAGWIADARGQGYQTTSTPSVGAIAVWGAQSGYSQFGHVAVVTAVTSNSYTVSEQNFKGAGIIDQRTVPWPDPKSAGFIPIPGGAP
jgi:hypothetical protein